MLGKWECSKEHCSRNASKVRAWGTDAGENESEIRAGRIVIPSSTKQLDTNVCKIITSRKLLFSNYLGDYSPSRDSHGGKFKQEDVHPDVQFKIERERRIGESLRGNRRGATGPRAFETEKGL